MREHLYRALLRPSRLYMFVSAVVITGCSLLPTGNPPHVSTQALAVQASTAAVTRPSSEQVAIVSVTPSASATPQPSPAPSVVPTLPPTPAPTVTPRPTLEPTPAFLPLYERQQIFEEVWQTVKDHYLYDDFRGVDWDALYDEYQPLVEASESRDEFYAYLVEMVARLDDHHSRFVPPSAALTEDAALSGHDVTVGIGVITKPKADGAFIQLVFPDSPAERARLRPRDRIIAVDGRPYVAEYGDLQGPDGSTVRLNVVRPGEKPRDVVLERQEIKQRIVPAYRRFPGDIGYVSIPTLWVNDMDEQVSGALTDLVAAGRLKGLILDVRANPGGWEYVLSGILSHFVRGQVGMFFAQRNVRALVVPQPAGPDLRNLPLVVLVDNDTASYAEVLAAVLRHEGRALVVGKPTAGNTETIYPYTLKDGSRLWLAQEGFRLPDGVNLEGQGVQPDSVVDVDWTRYSEEDDPQLLEALRLLGAGPK